MDTIKYFQNNINDLELIASTADKDQNALLFVLLGGHYLSKQIDYSKAEKYLLSAWKINKYSHAAYNLGYMYELQCDESNMINWYLEALNQNVYQAANQIGLHYLKQSKINQVINGKYVEEYLIIAAEHGIKQAENNLITLYKETNNYNKLVIILKHQLNGDPIKIMELMLLMLNNRDYKGYCQWLSTFKMPENTTIIFNPIQLLSNQASFEEDECCVCLETKKSIKLSCSHIVCSNCLFEIYKHLEPNCPICRKNL